MVGKVKELLGDVRASFQWLWFAPSSFRLFFSQSCKLNFLYCLLHGISIFFPNQFLLLLAIVAPYWKSGWLGGFAFFFPPNDNSVIFVNSETNALMNNYFFMQIILIKSNLKYQLLFKGPAIEIPTFSCSRNYQLLLPFHCHCSKVSSSNAYLVTCQTAAMNYLSSL